MTVEQPKLTIWSSAGRWEWILADGETLVERTGLVFNTRGKAKANFLRKYPEFK